MQKHHFIVTILFLASSLLHAQERVVYKKVDSTSLFLEVYYAKDIKKEKKSPGIVFFYGGGWQKGNINQFKPHAEYFSQRGITCFLVEYRIEKNITQRLSNL